MNASKESFFAALGIDGALIHLVAFPASVG